MAGSQDLFDAAFYESGGQILFKNGIDRSTLNSGQLMILSMVESSAIFLYFAGDEILYNKFLEG